MQPASASPSSSGLVSIHDRLLKREIGIRTPYSSARGTYGDRKWVRDLDIVNELEGHVGCVNALSWSKTGHLLASGSDDQRINIHHYLPTDTLNPFHLSTSVRTGHTQNIFSVKFMPYSNDRTVVSAAGDAQIRIFDIEYSSRSAVSNEGGNARVLTEGDTNARVYRSHSDRVKRIVTESSPHLFLTCSEDGEVRQWDLRQPSSAYPRPRDAGLRWRENSGDDTTDVPPPLISYRRHHIDLNTISCSGSQPHYIALGGAHLHCFLHDRRMLGRDRYAEEGKQARAGYDDEGISAATQCVRKFAPKGQQIMRRNERGHITACKISDAYPNSMIVSWSGDSIYGFDLVRSPDASERQERHPGFSHGATKSRVRSGLDRKRRRVDGGSTTSREAEVRASPRQRLSQGEHEGGDSHRRALRISYENGQSESIPIMGESDDEASTPGTGGRTVEKQTRAVDIADDMVRLRKQIFSPENGTAERETDMTRALETAATSLAKVDETIRTWGYPVNPSQVQTATQKLLRRYREKTRRLLQAGGIIARVQGGSLPESADPQTSRSTVSLFARITPAPNESLPETTDDEHELFCYDFIKAILLWLDSGPGGLLRGFGGTQNPTRPTRTCVPRDAPIEAIDETLIPSLLEKASSHKPIPNVDASPYEVASNRRVFSDEKAAVRAFAQALKIPFADLSSALSSPVEDNGASSSSGRPSAQDRQLALQFWGYRVCRGLLLSASKDVDHRIVFRAFGGLGHSGSAMVRDEMVLEERFGDLLSESEEDDPQIQSISFGRARGSGHAATVEDEDEDEFGVTADDLDAALMEGEGDYDVDEDEEDGGGDSYADDDGEDGDEDDEDDDELDEDEDGPLPRVVLRSAFERSALRAGVQRHVPCSAPTKQFTGHANVKTVKDVNFYGRNDEFVVSGSDTGHVFIWDAATTELLNILEGDGEVVNVITGHPHEPMLAVSGIDHTVKIFSPDKRLRREAQRGVGVENFEDPSGFSSLSFLGSRRRRRRMGGLRATGAARRRRAEVDDPLFVDDDDGDEEAEDEDEGADEDAHVPHSVSSDESDREQWQLRASGDDIDEAREDYSMFLRRGSRLASRRRWHQRELILAQNDVERQGGGGVGGDAFITRGMLAALAQRMRQARGEGGGGGGGDNDAAEGIEVPGGRIVITDDCAVM